MRKQGRHQAQPEIPQLEHDLRVVALEELRDRLRITRVWSSWSCWLLPLLAHWALELDGTMRRRLADATFHGLIARLERKYVATAPARDARTRALLARSREVRIDRLVTTQDHDHTRLN